MPCWTSHWKASIGAFASAPTSRSLATTLRRPHALKGDSDTAVVFLERAAMERRAFTIERARIEPEFDSLRGESRFQKLLSV